jgi:hypothetical protein
MHAEALQNSLDVSGLRQIQLLRMVIPHDLHPMNVMRRTNVLHSELQQHLPSELGKLSDMSTGEQHIIHVNGSLTCLPVYQSRSLTGKRKLRLIGVIVVNVITELT